MAIKTLQKVVRLLGDKSHTMHQLVAAYNPTQNPNPYEVLLAAQILNARTESWGEGMPPLGDIINNAMVSSRTERAPNPNTTIIQTLIKELDAIPMKEPNSWRDWCIRQAYFTGNVSIIDYFTLVYKNGKYADLFSAKAGIFNHPDKNRTGALLNINNTGSDGVVSVFANTVIYTGASQFADDTGTSPYFTLNAFGVALPYQFYFSQNDMDVPKVIAGGTFADIQIAITGTETAAQMRDLIYAAIDGTSAFTVTTDGNNVIATATGPGTTTGEFNYTNLLMFPDVSKLYDFTADGPAVGAEPAEFEINFTYADTLLADRFFMIADTNGLSTLLYYDLDASGTFITPPPAAPDNTIAIPITTGMTASDIQTATETILEGLGYLTISSPRKRITCCVYNITGEIDLFDQGTMAIGVNYKYNSDIKGSDGTVLASDVSSDTDYIAYWNTSKVAHEATLGLTYPYLNSGILSTGGDKYYPIDLGNIGEPGGFVAPCAGCQRYGGLKPQFVFGSGSPGQEFRCVPCRDVFGSAGNSSGGFTIYAYSPTSTGGPGYNTPGNIFIASEGRQANLTAIGNLI
jgi:hypothetical protein